jgi:hypothetical protein
MSPCQAVYHDGQDQLISFSLAAWDLNLLARQVFYHLSHFTSLFFFFCDGCFFEIGSCELFAQAGFELKSS